MPGTLQMNPNGSAEGSTRPLRESTTVMSPSAGTRATAPPTRWTAAKSRSGATWIAVGSTSCIAGVSPSTGVSSSPARKPKPASVSTRGGPVTRVERVSTVSASSGVEATIIWASATPALARLAVSCVCMRSSVIDSTRSASALRVTCATPDSRGTDGRARETLSGNALWTDSESQALWVPSTSASAMRVAAFVVGNHRTSGTRYCQLRSKYMTE